MSSLYEKSIIIDDILSILTRYYHDIDTSSFRTAKHKILSDLIRTNIEELKRLLSKMKRDVDEYLKIDDFLKSEKLEEK